MKKIILAALTLFACAGIASAQEVQDSVRTYHFDNTVEMKIPKRHYINLAYANQKLKADGLTYKADFGAAVEFGTTYFFNARKPVARMIRFGLDFSYLDLQYATYKLDGETARFGNIGVQVGPSITVSPFDWLHAKAYFHYAPSCATLFPTDKLADAMIGYAGYITGGIQVSYKFLTVGVEFRGCSSKLSTVGGGDDDEEDYNEYGDYEDDGSNSKLRVHLPSTRIMIGFRF